jgi:hypothetical protein
MHHSIVIYSIERGMELAAENTHHPGGPSVQIGMLSWNANKPFPFNTNLST